VFDKKILVEVCPTSNIITKELNSLKEHHMTQFVEKGVPITISTDDILLFRNSLSEEIHLVTETFDYGVDFLEKICRDSVDYSFVREENVRSQLKSRVDEFFSKKDEWK